MVSLLSIFIGAIYETVIVGLRAVNAADEREDVRGQLFSALDRLTRETRMARNVDHATDQQFQFDMDTDGDGASTGAEQNVDYEVIGGVLTRAANGGSAVTIVRSLTSLDFNYLKNGSVTEYSTCDATSSCSSQCCRTDVRAVLITASATRDQETISMTSAAFLDNM